MTVGSPTVKTLNETKPGLRYTCLQSILTRGFETPDFPKEPCPAGMLNSRYTVVLVSTHHVMWRIKTLMMYCNHPSCI